MRVITLRIMRLTSTFVRENINYENMTHLNVTSTNNKKAM